MTNETNDEFIQRHRDERNRNKLRRRGILSTIIGAGLPGFAVEPLDDESEDKSFVLANAHVRIQAWFWIDKGVERITFSGLWPRAGNAYSMYLDGPSPTATVSAARPARQVANVVANKIYPKVRGITAAIYARIRAEELRASVVLTAAADLVTALARFKPWTSFVRGDRRAYGINGGEVVVETDGRYSLALKDLSLEQVKAIMVARG